MIRTIILIAPGFVKLDTEGWIHLSNILIPVWRHTVRATGQAIRNQRMTSGVGRYTISVKEALPTEASGSPGDWHPGDDCGRNGTGSGKSMSSSGSGNNGGNNRDESVACHKWAIYLGYWGGSLCVFYPAKFNATQTHRAIVKINFNSHDFIAIVLQLQRSNFTIRASSSASGHRS